MESTKIIKRPVITEKSTQSAAQGKYTFRVDPRATKAQIAEAVKKVFGVSVRNVWVAVMPRKTKRFYRFGRRTKANGWKKAIVQIGEREKIDLLEVS